MQRLFTIDFLLSAGPPLTSEFLGALQAHRAEGFGQLAVAGCLPELGRNEPPCVILRTAAIFPCPAKNDQRSRRMPWRREVDYVHRLSQLWGFGRGLTWVKQVRGGPR